MINVIKDIDLINEYDKYDLILVPSNCYNKLSNGFPRKIRKRFPVVHERLMETNYGDFTKLGNILLIDETKPQFCLCFITESYNFRPDLNKEYLNYEALKKCLVFINDNFKNLNIATTLLGTSKFDGNGDYNKVFSLFNECCDSVNITIYDYIQKGYDEENKEEYLEIKKYLEKGDYKTYKNLLTERKERLKKYGHF